MIDLEKKANEIRIDIIEMLYHAKSGHPGSSLSVADILTVLYHKEMNLDLDKNGKRIDKLVLSKGHAAPALYACLASVNILDKSVLNTLRKSGSKLEGHPNVKTPGIDAASGSLGQGLSIANGIGLAKKTNKTEGYVYVILGDGEVEEGQIWEAFMTNSKYNLNNVIPIIDNNGLQIDGKIEDVKKLVNLEEKIKAFGLNVIKCDGNDINDVIRAIKEAKDSELSSCIIAKTIKGKGVSFMENEVSWHGKSITEEDYLKAMKELKSKV